METENMRLIRPKKPKPGGLEWAQGLEPQSEMMSINAGDSSSSAQQNKEAPSSKGSSHGEMVAAHGPEWGLNSRSAAPVRPDYQLSKKNEILVDLFLNTLFHPPQTPPPPLLPSFLLTKFSTSFFWLFSLPTGSGVQVRGHLAAPEGEQPGNKAPPPCPPPPPQETPGGMLQ